LKRECFYHFVSNHQDEFNELRCFTFTPCLLAF
jgi:hypothetical protein